MSAEVALPIMPPVIIPTPVDGLANPKTPRSK
jgi:hypothetical protein